MVPRINAPEFIFGSVFNFYKRRGSMKEHRNHRKWKLLCTAKECGAVFTFSEYLLNYLYDMETPEVSKFIDLKLENEELRRGLHSVKFQKMKHSDFAIWILRQQERMLSKINLETDLSFLAALQKLVENYSILFAGKDTSPYCISVLEDIKRQIAILEHPINLATVYQHMKVFPDYLVTEDLIRTGAVVLIRDVEGIPRFYQNPAYPSLKTQCVMNANGENIYEDIIMWSEENDYNEEMEKRKRMER